MTGDEGVVKYDLRYTPSPLPEGADLDGLLRWFRVCRTQGLIGRDPMRYGGFAYGNISARAPRGFVISATQTGGDAALSTARLAWVQDFDVAANSLRAGGPARPSSEAMSHGQVYRALPRVNAVIHVHSPALWHAAADLGLPVTPFDAAYGTPAMASAVNRVLGDADGGRAGAFAMGGHEDGIVAYGVDFDAAGGRLLELLRHTGSGDWD